MTGLAPGVGAAPPTARECLPQASIFSLSCFIYLFIFIPGTGTGTQGCSTAELPFQPCYVVLFILRQGLPTLPGWTLKLVILWPQPLRTLGLQACPIVWDQLPPPLTMLVSTLVGVLSTTFRLQAV